jgi:hypothetical protein
MKRSPDKRRSKSAPAQRFHEFAWPFLATLGFELVDDPESIRSTYQVTCATYRSAQNFFLAIGFDPFDGNYAEVTGGRQWRAEDGWYCLSNHLCTLAKRLGLDFPRTYHPLGYGAGMQDAMERILADLKNVLPVVIERVTLADLVMIEAEEFGAHYYAVARYGRDYATRVRVSEFSRLAGEP